MPRKFTEHSKAYIADYRKTHTTRVAFQLNNEHDKDILDYLKTLPNKNAYLKALIRKDMKSK